MHNTLSEILSGTHGRTAQYLDLSRYLEDGERLEGERVSPWHTDYLRDWEEPEHERATHVIIHGTTWGDYVGSIVTRSDCERIREDFPGRVVTVTGGYGSESLAVALDWAPDEDWNEDDGFGDVLAAMFAGEIYDDGSVFDLERELGDEAWDNFGAMDWRDEIRDAALPLSEAIYDEVDEYLSEMDVMALSGLVTDLCGHHGDHQYEWPNFVAEDATGSGYWEGLGDLVQPALVESLARLDRAERVRPVPVHEDQMTLTI